MSALAERTISRSASKSAVAKPDQVAGVDKARHALNRGTLTRSYVEAKVDAHRLRRAGFGADSRKTEAGKPGNFGGAASFPVAPGDAGASKPITIASAGHLTTWVLTSGGVINRSNDGVSWQPLSSGTDRDLIAGTAPSAEICWVVGRGGTILRTTDGEQWERIASPAEADLLNIAATDEYSAIVLTADGRRFATDNGGKTWQLTRN
jgi:hypothetical protein